MALASRTDVVEALAMTAQGQRLRAPREKARLIVEIWAEAGRNPRIAQITSEFDAETFVGLRKLLTEAKAKRMLPLRHIDVEFVAGAIVTIVSGMFKRLAIEDDFDRERESRLSDRLLRALLSGRRRADAAFPSRRQKDAEVADCSRRVDRGRGRRCTGRRQIRALRAVHGALNKTILHDERLCAGSLRRRTRRAKSSRRRSRWRPRSAAASSTGCSSPARLSRARKRKSRRAWMA